MTPMITLPHSWSYFFIYCNRGVLLVTVDGTASNSNCKKIALAHQCPSPSVHLSKHHVIMTCCFNKWTVGGLLTMVTLWQCLNASPYLEDSLHQSGLQQHRPVEWKCDCVMISIMDLRRGYFVKNIFKSKSIYVALLFCSSLDLLVISCVGGNLHKWNFIQTAPWENLDLSVSRQNC